MFEKLRKPRKNKSTIFYIFSLLLSALIVIVFIFVGVFPEQLGGPLGGSAAIVNDYNISTRHFQQSLDQVLSRFPEQQRKLYSTILRQQVLQKLVQEELFSQAIKKEGFVVAPYELKQTLTQLPVFKDEGFSMSYYHQFLKYIKMSPQAFEAQISKSILSQRFHQLLKFSLELSSKEKNLLAELYSHKVSFSYVDLSKKDVKKVTLENVNAFLRKNQNQKKLKDYYRQNEFSFVKDDQVKARHILFSFVAGSKESENKLF